MPKQYFEDFPVGRVLEFGDYEITGNALAAYRAAFDPVPPSSDLSRIASGWHVAAALSRLACDGFLLESSSAGGPGVARFEYFKPVRSGDRLWSRTTVLKSRASRTKPHLGFVDFRFEIIRRPDDPVAVMDGGVIFGVRDPKDPEPAATSSAAREPAAEDVAAQTLPASASPLDNSSVGSRVDLGDYEFAYDQVLAFASEFDPQPFHLDDGRAATHSHFGKIAASGWHTAAALASRLAASRGEQHASMRAFRDLVWHRPVHVGDRLSFSAVLSAKRVDQFGAYATLQCTALNQHGQKAARIDIEEVWGPTSF